MMNSYLRYGLLLVVIFLSCNKNPIISSSQYKNFAQGFWRAVRGDTDISSGCGMVVYNWYAIETNTSSNSVIVTWDDGIACTRTPGTIYGNRITIEDCSVTAFFKIHSDSEATATFQTEDTTYTKRLKKIDDSPKMCWW